MSGIYISEMKMPTRCIACQLNYDSCACILTGSRFYKYNTEFDPGEERLPDCPLIPVPDHGRLIDADALFDFILNIYKTAQGDARKAYCDVLDTIVAAGDFIPADKEGE